MSETKPMLESVLAAARAARPAFELAIGGVSFEPLGVLYSEALFVRACLEHWKPGRIVESGRARGQSTILLARTFPEVAIHSVEIDPSSPHAKVASLRLAGYANVQLLFGDSRRVLPELVRPGDVVVVDGPKGYRGLKLVLRLLAFSRPAFVFMHDCQRGSEERDFFEREIPNALYSDAPQFELEHADLDRLCYPPTREGENKGWRPHVYKGRPQESYGPTYACLPWSEGVAYAWILQKLRIEAVFANAARSLRKRTGGDGE